MEFEDLNFNDFDTLPLIANRISRSTGFFNQFSPLLHEINGDHCSQIFKIRN